MISTPNEHDAPRVATFKNRARARHETFNSRLKDFHALSQKFCHNRRTTSEEDYVAAHKRVFEAVCVLVN